MAAERGAAAPTGAMSDIYEHGRDRVAELCAGVRRRDGQTGALVSLGGNFAVADLVSRSDAFAALFAPLLSGYALDALEHTAALPPSRAEAEDFLARACASRVTEHSTVGLGRSVALIGASLGGTGLVVEAELIQLSVYTYDDAAPVGPRVADRGRIRRTSRRRDR